MNVDATLFLVIVILTGCSPKPSPANRPEMFSFDTAYRYAENGRRIAGSGVLRSCVYIELANPPVFIKELFSGDERTEARKAMTCAIAVEFPERSGLDPCKDKAIEVDLIVYRQLSCLPESDSCLDPSQDSTSYCAEIRKQAYEATDKAVKEAFVRLEGRGVDLKNARRDKVKLRGIVRQLCDEFTQIYDAELKKQNPRAKTNGSCEDDEGPDQSSYYVELAQ